MLRNLKFGYWEGESENYLEVVRAVGRIFSLFLSFVLEGLWGKNGYYLRGYRGSGFRVDLVFS